jgi:hypothetical protein
MEGEVSMLHLLFINSTLNIIIKKAAEKAAPKHNEKFSTTIS